MEGVAAFFQNMVNSFSDAVFQSLIKEDRYQYLLRGLGISLLLTLLLFLLVGGGLMRNVLNYMVQLLSNVGALL